MAQGRKTDLEVVLATLKDAKAYPAPGYSKASREMLAAGLPHAAGTHEYQQGMLKLVTQLLHTARTAAASDQIALTEKAKLAEERVSVAEVALSEAEQATTARRQERDSKVKAAKAAQAVATQAQAYHESLVEARRLVEGARSVVLRRRDASLAAGEALRKFGSGELEESPAEQVLAVFREEQAEEALLTAAPHALKVQPSNRGYFDGIVVKEATSFLEQVATTATQQLESGREEAKDAEVEALGAWAVLDVAHERCAVADVVLGTAAVALRSQEAAEEEAKADLQGCKTALSQCLVQQTLGEVKIKELDLAATALERYIRAVILDAQESKAVQEELEAAPTQKLGVEEEVAGKDEDMAPVNDKVELPLLLGELPDAARMGA